MAVLIDTSVLVAVERGVLTLEALIEPEAEYAISAVTVGELLHGVLRARGKVAQTRSAFVEGVLNSLAMVPVDMPVARAYAHAAAILSAEGIPVNPNDLWIGATAIATGMEVLALDGDFQRIPGVRVVST